MPIAEPNHVLAGIDPATRKCALVGSDVDTTWEEARSLGLIVVPVTVATARAVWGELVPDIYAIAFQQPAPESPR